jgi:hypothetical protein
MKRKEQKETRKKKQEQTKQSHSIDRAFNQADARNSISISISISIKKQQT